MSYSVDLLCRWPQITVEQERLLRMVPTYGWWVPTSSDVGPVNVDLIRNLEDLVALGFLYTPLSRPAEEYSSKGFALSQYGFQYLLRLDDPVFVLQQACLWSELEYPGRDQ